MQRVRIGKRLVPAAIVTLSLLLAVTLFVHAQQSPAAVAVAEATAFVCPMHPDYTLDIAGRCPRCGMALVRSAPFDVRDYGLEFTTEPAVVRAARNRRRGRRHSPR